MIDAFKQHIQKELKLKDDKVVLAVSGGVDSICMVHMFEQSRMNYCIAHCNFKLRGEDADKDEQLVEKLAAKNNVEFYHTSFDTYAYSRDMGLSIQMAARDLRYEWLRSIKKETKSKYIATAHHLSDSLETAIFNLAKGTGVAGLKGISVKVNDIIRPLLFATKEEIQQYAINEKLNWREDASNQTVKYSRNFIRHQTIDGLKKKVNPSIEHTFRDTSERIKAVEYVYQNHIEGLKQKFCSKYRNYVSVDISWVKDSHHVPMVYEIIREYGFSYKQNREILLGSQLSGASLYSDEYWLVKDRDRLIITTKEIDTSEIMISKDQLSVEYENIGISVKQSNAKEIEIIRDSSYAYLDLKKLEFPLKIRSWQEGDRFQPLGMKGKKKVSDFMIDQKIPVNLKKQVRILISGNRIAWIVGMRIDDYFKITDDTTDVYCLKIVEPNA